MTRNTGAGVFAMVEIAVASAVVLVLLACSARGAIAHADLLLLAGAGMVALGLVAGVSAGVVYHVRLYRELAPLGLARPGWWWRPTSLHVHLPPPGRRRVLPWFYVGAAGFFVTVAGCALVLAALMTR